MDQGSNENHSPVNNFVPTVTKFCVLWEGQALPHDTKFGNCRDKIVDSRAFLSWSLIHGSSWSGLIKLGPDDPYYQQVKSKVRTHRYSACLTPTIVPAWLTLCDYFSKTRWLWSEALYNKQFYINVWTILFIVYVESIHILKISLYHIAKSKRTKRRSQNHVVYCLLAVAASVFHHRLWCQP